MNTTNKTLAAVASLALLASSAFGDSLKMTTSAYSNGGLGGSYTVTVLSGPASNSDYNPLAIVTPGSFESFCLEPTEYFSPGSTYDYTIASFAFGGANEAAGRNATIGDQLSLGTTWLYYQFATGTLAGFDYSAAGRQASNLLLQRAFWYLEDDFASYSTSALALANPFLSAAASKFGTLGAAQADASNGAYGVQVLNISTTSTAGVITQNQSQLYYHKVPDNGTTLAMLGLAFLGLAVFKRKFGSAS